MLSPQLNKGFTKFPGNRALGEIGDPRLAETAAFVMGQELRAVGINMEFGSCSGRRIAISTIQ